MTEINAKLLTDLPDILGSERSAQLVWALAEKFGVTLPTGRVDFDLLHKGIAIERADAQTELQDLRQKLKSEQNARAELLADREELRTKLSQMTQKYEQCQKALSETDSSGAAMIKRFETREAELSAKLVEVGRELEEMKTKYVAEYRKNNTVMETNRELKEDRDRLDEVVTDLRKRRDQTAIAVRLLMDHLEAK